MILEYDGQVPSLHKRSGTISFQLSVYNQSKKLRDQNSRNRQSRSLSKQFPFQSLVDNYQKIKNKSPLLTKTATNRQSRVDFLTKYLKCKSTTFYMVNESINCAKIPSAVDSLMTVTNSIYLYQPKFMKSPYIDKPTRTNSNLFRTTRTEKKCMASTKRKTRRAWANIEEISDKSKILEQLNEMNDRHTNQDIVQKDEVHERIKTLLVTMRNKIYEGSRMLKKVGDIS